MNQEYLQSVLHYNESNGLFTWKINKSSKVKFGKTAGSVTNQGYIEIWIDYRRYQAHRLAWMYIYGKFPEKLIDHINGNKSDNRLDNLRLATNKENCQNSRLSKKNTSGVKGVSWHTKTKKWRAYIKNHGKFKHLGLFDDFFEACCVACSNRSKLHKEFARNF